jgi:streptogramin lyase
MTIHGSVHGGQQPIAGALIYLMTPNSATNGLGTASLVLLNANVLINEPIHSGIDGNGNFYITTATDGSFSLTFGSDYSCTSGTDQGGDAVSLPGDQPVYLYAVSGNSGAGTNSAAGFLASLGPCNGLSGSTSVQMNEMTTVAMAYAAAGYATDATDITSNGSNLATTGIGNAFANTTNLVDLPSGHPLATTPAGNGTVPLSEITTLANILAACVNSADAEDGIGAFVSYSPACSQLLTTATSDGTPGGTNPTDTATAAIYIAHNPGANVTTLFGSTPTSPAFGGGLTTKPHDFTIALLFTGGGFQGTGDEPQDLAIDNGGDVWSAGSSLSEFSPLGAVTSYGSSNGINLNSGIGVAVSADSSQIWITDNDDSNVTDFTVSGSSAVRYTTGIVTRPFGIAIEGLGNIYFTDPTNNYLLEMAPSGAMVGAVVSGNGLANSRSISIQAGTSGTTNIWVANASAFSDSVFYAGPTGPTALVNDALGGVANPLGSAIDANGYVWTANQNNTVSKLDSSGTVGSYFSIRGTAPHMDGIAIDGGGNVWATDQADNTVVVLNNAGTTLSGTTGYPPVNGDTPDAIAVDGSGDIWYTTSSSNSLYELIGAAVPVVTPIAYGVTFSRLGTRP